MAFMMGVPSEDCLRVAELLGIKTFLNEFIAYMRLGVLMGGWLVEHRATGVFISILYMPQLEPA